MIYYAHSSELDKSNWQTVKDHLENTARLALSLGEDTGLSEFAYIVASLHDIGKYSHAFQRKLKGANLRIDHSTAGAQEVIKLFKKDANQQLMGMLLAYCIAGHHSGLLDYGSVIDSETDGTLQARLKKKLPDYKYYAQEIDILKFVCDINSVNIEEDECAQKN